MSSAGEIIDQALKDVGVIGAGEAASGEDAADALSALNQLIAEWQMLQPFVPKEPYVLAQLPDLTAPLNLPPFYDGALRYSLGERLLVAFSLQPRADIGRLASQARKVLKRSNLVIPELEMPYPLLASPVYRSE